MAYIVVVNQIPFGNVTVVPLSVVTIQTSHVVPYCGHLQFKIRILYKRGIRFKRGERKNVPLKTGIKGSVCGPVYRSQIFILSMDPCSVALFSLSNCVIKCYVQFHKYHFKCAFSFSVRNDEIRKTSKRR